jgi:hypothetical protein
MFAGEPWLDVPPGVDAQAQLLCRLASISPSELLRASHELRLHERPLVHEINTVGAAQNAGDSGTVPAPLCLETDPRRFLLSVMNDPAIEIALRIEAAKALLP